MTWEMTDDETKAMTQSKPHHALNKGRKDGREEGKRVKQGREEGNMTQFHRVFCEHWHIPCSQNRYVNLAGQDPVWARRNFLWSWIKAYDLLGQLCIVLMAVMEKKLSNADSLVTYVKTSISILHSHDTNKHHKSSM